MCDTIIPADEVKYLRERLESNLNKEKKRIIGEFMYLINEDIENQLKNDIEKTIFFIDKEKIIKALCSEFGEHSYRKEGIDIVTKNNFKINTGMLIHEILEHIRNNGWKAYNTGTKLELQIDEKDL